MGSCKIPAEYGSSGKSTKHQPPGDGLTFEYDPVLRIPLVGGTPVRVDKYNRPGRIYNDALNHLAMCQTGLNDYSNAIATLKTYLGLLPENSEKISTLVRIADAYRKMDNWDFAATTFNSWTSTRTAR